MLKKLLFIFFGLGCLMASAESTPVELINAGEGVDLDFKQTNTWEYSSQDYNFEVGGTLTFNCVIQENAQLKFLVGTKVIFNTVQLESDTYVYTLTEENVANLSAGKKFVIQGRNCKFKSLYYTAPDGSDNGDDGDDNGDNNGDDNGDDNGDGDDDGDDSKYTYTGVLMNDLNLSLSWATDYKIILNQKVSQGDVLEFNGTATEGGSPRFTFAYQTIDNFTWTELLTAAEGETFNIEVKDEAMAQAFNELGFFVKGSDLVLNTISYKGNTEITEGGTVNGSAAGEGDGDNDFEGEEDLEGAFVSGVHFDSWDTPMVIIPPTFFEKAKENDMLFIYYSAPKGGQSGGKMQLAYNDKSIEDPTAQWTMITSEEKIRGDGTYEVPLKGILEYLKQDGFFVKGYNFTFVKATLMIATGVETETANNNCPVEYYNLQGVRLNAPAPGSIVIVRQGSDIKKVIF